MYAYGVQPNSRRTMDNVENDECREPANYAKRAAKRAKCNAAKPNRFSQARPRGALRGRARGVSGENGGF